jgi:hypothetical protein
VDTTPNLTRALALLALLAVALLAGACAGGPEKDPLSLNADFSSNVMPTPHFWPREKVDFPESEQARQAWRDALAEHGRPDFLWFVHTFDREPVLVDDLRSPERIGAMRQEPLIDWIYIDKKMVLSFSGAQTERMDLSDKARTLCLYGDPNEVRPFATADGSQEPRWLYYVHGREFAFRGDTLVGTYRFPPMPGYQRSF